MKGREKSKPLGVSGGEGEEKKGGNALLQGKRR